MSTDQEIVRLAAKGDGITADGRHQSGALPGDILGEDGIAAKGPHHVTPPCRHFGKCGGCQLQHADETVLANFVRDRVVNSALGQGLEIGELLPEYLSPPASRRRATLHAMRTHKGAIVGYREAGSHKIVDLAECHVIDPRIAALVPPLRAFVARFGPRKGAVDIQLTLCDQGVDVGITNLVLEGLEPTEASLDLAREHGFARLTLDQGYGAETVWEPEPVTVTMSGVPVGMPAGSFLQATPDAEQRMIADAQEWMADANIALDLFAGLGTFAFALRQGRKMLVVEADQAAHLASKDAAGRAGGTLFTMHRDLFRNPLDAAELSRFDAALLDPPRAGARTQIAQIAASDLARVVYVSCNPSSWARDAAQLAEAGFKLTKLRPIGQFRWSTHVELISLLER
ncbi:class I SAM-dependent RNA methyltransferase [Erythrobacter sp. MTPC3]|uniref:class I SAM-dependent RNA methyltransferase n=1 Tax=Erythrobacter sp. MTPC3 TaxID=3056564 RepID=UPI0036F1A81F